MCLTETFLSSNVNKTKLAEYAKQACLYATGYYSRRLPHTNFATNSRGISVESRVIAQFLDTTTYTKTKEEVSNTILRRARPGHIRLHKPLRCAKLLSSRRQERVPTSHGHCWGQVRYLKYFKNIFFDIMNIPVLHWHCWGQVLDISKSFGIFSLILRISYSEYFFDITKIPALHGHCWGQVGSRQGLDIFQIPGMSPSENLLRLFHFSSSACWNLFGRMGPVVPEGFYLLSTQLGWFALGLCR